MVSRLVVGCGTIGATVVSTVREWPGDLLVVTDDEGRVETLRADGVAAEVADPTDPAVLREVDGPVDVVFVAADDPDRNRRAAEVARSVYPDAVLVAYAGEGGDGAGLAPHADRVVDPGGVVAEHLVDSLGGAGGEGVRGLRRVLGAVDGTLGVVTHDNPDPDAIASAVALVAIAESAGVDSEVAYYGEISRQENRAMVNLLELELRRLEPDEDPDYGAIALVDHSRPGINDQLPEDTSVDVVIDHHPPRGPVEARFVDLRTEVGATSTLLSEYLRRLDLAPEESVATALLYGIRVDTRDFTREVSPADFDAAAYLVPYADVSILERIESPSVTGETLDTIARAIRNREVEGSVLASCVGSLGDRDAVAQAAERLVSMEGIDTSLVFGFTGGVVHLSARSRTPDLDIGETLRTAFGQIGSAGGHADMAGAQISLGVLGAVDEDESALADIVTDVITDRFFETVRGRPRNVPTGYAAGTDVTLGPEPPPDGLDRTGDGPSTDDERSSGDDERSSGDDERAADGTGSSAAENGGR